MPQLVRTINHIRFVIVSDDQSLIDEQERLLSKNVFSLQQDADEEICLHYVKNQRLFDDIQKCLSSQKLQPIETFKNEQHFKGTYQNLPAYKKDKNEYCVVVKNNEFWFVANPEVDTSIFIPRLITELLLRKMEDKGSVLSHTTGVQLENKGLFLTNNSGGGKTTLMTKIFDGGKNIGVLSNDRVFSCFKDGIIPTMEYVPFEVHFEIETIYSSPNLLQYFSKTNQLEKVQQRGKGQVALCDMDKVYPKLKRKTTSKIDCVLIPKIDLSDLEGKKFRIEEANKEYVQQVLAKNTFTPHDLESPRNPWLCPRVKSEEELVEQAKSFVRKMTIVPAYIIEFQPKASNEEICEGITKLSK